MTLGVFFEFSKTGLQNMEFVDENGEKHCIKNLARLQGVAYNTLVYRRMRGWSDLEIIAGKREKVSKSRLMEFKDEIVSMRMAGRSLSDIGNRFCVDTSSVIRFLKSIGFDGSKINNSINAKTAGDVLRLRNNGCSITEIAKKLKVSHSTVWHYFQRLNIVSLPKRPKRAISSAEKEAKRISKNKRVANWRKRHKHKNSIKRIERRKKDPVFALKENVRAVTRNAFKRKRWNKGTQTHDLLGCDWIELKAWIESLFANGMSWDNMGEWHIDHKIPLASASTVEELRELCRFTNLQPLWARDNLSKGAKK